MEYLYYIYILTNTHNTVLYIGVTNHIERRLQEHLEGRGSDFCKKYNLRKLVYIESTSDTHTAIAREKQLKGWRRDKKNALIELQNPQWNDLAKEWNLVEIQS